VKRNSVLALLAVLVLLLLGYWFWGRSAQESVGDVAVDSAQTEATTAISEEPAISEESAEEVAVSQESTDEAADTTDTASSDAAPTEADASGTTDQGDTLQEATDTLQKMAEIAALPEGDQDADGPVLPTFDIVRVEKDGSAVMAGRAESGSLVSVIDNGDSLESVQASGDGQWVVALLSPLKPGDHELGLLSKLENGDVLVSEQVVVVSVPYPSVADSDAGGVASQAGQADTAAEPLVVLASRSGDEPSRILQDSQGAGEGLASGTLVLESVDYDERGNALIAGKSEPGAHILVYLDDQLIGETRADDQGLWQISPDVEIAVGLHRLRVDQLDINGALVARVETPFSRAEVLAALSEETQVVVQPGNSLWRIARRVYGEGIRYSVIYQANAELIQDPDLIYPGQIFVVPPTE
jgi:LysM repeat protein